MRVDDNPVRHTAFGATGNGWVGIDRNGSQVRPFGTYHLTEHVRKIDVLLNDNDTRGKLGRFENCVSH